LPRGDSTLGKANVFTRFKYLIYGVIVHMDLAAGKLPVSLISGWKVEYRGRTQRKDECLSA